jgi:Tfp pilus assembly protein PilF
MQIIHIVNDFLFMIFPNLSLHDNESIIMELTKFFSTGGQIPKVTVENDRVTIVIDTNIFTEQQQAYNEVIAYCEAKNYTAAKPIISDLLVKNPANSEYHRILGQILSEEGNREEAINSLIDSLRWNPKNDWALLMMGNIFAKYKNDLSTAIKYYDQALLSNPNNITKNNIGANLLQQGTIEAAKKYFEKALYANNKYPNTHYGLGMLAEVEGDLDSAFYSFTQSIRFSNKKDVLYEKPIDQLVDISKRIIKKNTERIFFAAFKNKLELEGGTGIDIIEDGNIPTAAKIEIAFIKGLTSTTQKLKKSGISDNSISKYLDALFDGMNSQIFNAPVDLFIEDVLYTRYPELRAFQFLSIYNIIKESINAVTNKKIIDLSPKEIVAKSKVYNLVNAIQFEELFGVDLINEFKATPSEIKQGKGLYEEYLQYKTDKEPGEEYEVIQHWAEDLNVGRYFVLVREEEFDAKFNDVNDLLTSIIDNPYDLGVNEDEKNKEMEQFQEAHAELGINMAVATYMIEALHYFQGKSESDIKDAAFEIAMQRTQGYKPEGKSYRVSNIPNKIITGFQILAYYYVSWSLVLLEMVKDLHLPYANEYKLALNMHNQ